VSVALFVLLALPTLAANLWAVVYLHRFVPPIAHGIRNGALIRVGRGGYNSARSQMWHTLRLTAKGQL
jgi:hypothetical protein